MLFYKCHTEKVATLTTYFRGKNGYFNGNAFLQMLLLQNGKVAILTCWRLLDLNKQVPMIFSLLASFSPFVGASLEPFKPQRASWRQF